MSLQTINVQKSLIWKKVLFSGNKMKNRLQFDKQCCAAMHFSESEPFITLFYIVFENVCVIFMPERLEKKPYNVISATSV